MKKITLILILLIFSLNSSAQKKTELSDNAYILNSRIKNFKIDTFSLFGVKTISNKYHLKSKLIVQVRESFLGDKNKFSYRKGEYIVRVIEDSSGVLLDSILNRLDKYWENEKQESIKYNSGNDLTNVLVNESFYLNNNDTIPYIQTMGERKGNYAVFWYNGFVYYIEVFKEPKGFGPRSGFIRSCFRLSNNEGKDLELIEFVKDIEKAKLILGKMKTKHNKKYR